MTNTKLAAVPEPPAAVSAPPDTLELAAQWEEEIRFARELGVKLSRTIAESEAEIRAAERAHPAALDAVVRSEPDAEEKLRASTVRVTEAYRQRQGLDEHVASAQRVEAQAKARLAQLRITCLDEFLAPVEAAITTELASAIEALREPLQRYTAAWQGVTGMLRPLAPAIRVRVEADDAKAGLYRTGELLEKDLRVPSCPIDAATLGAVATTVPRPAALGPHYERSPYQFAAAASVDVAPPPPAGIIFPGMAGAQ